MMFTKPTADADQNPLAVRIEAARDSLRLQMSASAQAAAATYRGARTDRAKAMELLTQSLRADFAAGATKSRAKSNELQKEVDRLTVTVNTARQALADARAAFQPKFLERAALPAASLAGEMSDAIALVELAAAGLADIHRFAIQNGLVAPLNAYRAEAVLSTVRALRLQLAGGR
ncbi:hypothetical protein C1D09_003900 [Mesorhizobium intechi]|uniref:Uncharacterized protein n=1 Tax=Mesorhizobium intechi TaxID=537601 RepID=A0A8T9AWT4_9HYPH|nr:hypothetical protein [Mesorhizobium intechi]TSE13466.1 hypothetical protein C1D09_003900 [Mesorhizobium intechi]